MASPHFALEGKIALVTGGSRGIGKEIALQMARQGANVIVCGRKQESIDAALEEFTAQGLAITGRTVHIAKSERVKDLMQYISGKFGGLDVVVNNVGMNVFTPSVLGAEESLFDKVMETNLKGTFLVCKYAVPLLKEKQGGKIINITTIAARRAAMGMGIYGIAKAAVEMMTRVLAVELAPFNVQVNAVAPCMVRTDFSKPFWGNESIHKEITKTIPMGRIAEPSEVAGAVLFLASPAADFITGDILAVDGGSLAR